MYHNNYDDLVEDLPAITISVLQAYPFFPAALDVRTYFASEDGSSGFQKYCHTLLCCRTIHDY